MESDIHKRIAAFMKFKELSMYRFSQAIGSNPSSISAVINSKSKPSYDMLEKIAVAFPDLNTEWLLRGYGPMLRESTLSPALPWEILKQEEAQHEVLKQSYDQLKRRTEELSENVAWLTREVSRLKGTPAA